MKYICAQHTPQHNDHHHRTEPYHVLRPGYTQGGHWRCDYVTDLVFQEKSYKTNLHLFSAYTWVVWRSVKTNNCSRESIFSERRSYREKVIFIPFFIATAFNFEFTHCSTSCHIKDCVLIIEWFQWQCQGSLSQRLAMWFVHILILKELTKSFF